YFSFGRHLDELHVTWAHLEKKRTRLQTNTKTLEDLSSQSLETASQAIHDAVTPHTVTTPPISRRGTSATHWYLQVADTVPVLNIDHQRYEDLELEKNRNRLPLAVLFEIDPGELDAAISAASHARTEKQQPEAGKRLLNYVNRDPVLDSFDEIKYEEPSTNYDIFHSNLENDFEEVREDKNEEDVEEQHPKQQQ
ncbi:hypothetical protein Tco_0938266, partial [Tanacetum coccineum]